MKEMQQQQEWYDFGNSKLAYPVNLIDANNWPGPKSGYFIIYHIENSETIFDGRGFGELPKQILNESHSNGYHKENYFIRCFPQIHYKKLINYL